MRMSKNNSRGAAFKKESYVMIELSAYPYGNTDDMFPYLEPISSGVFMAPLRVSRPSTFIRMVSSHSKF